MKKIKFFVGLLLVFSGLNFSNAEALKKDRIFFEQFRHLTVLTDEHFNEIQELGPSALQTGFRLKEYLEKKVWAYDESSGQLVAIDAPEIAPLILASLMKIETTVSQRQLPSRVRSFGTSSVFETHFTGFILPRETIAQYLGKSNEEVRIIELHLHRFSHLMKARSNSSSFDQKRIETAFRWDMGYYLSSFFDQGLKIASLDKIENVISNDAPTSSCALCSFWDVWSVTKFR